MAPKAMLALPLAVHERPMVLGPAWGMEIKEDGHRKVIVTGPKGPRSHNRDGNPSAQALPAPIVDALSTLTTPAVLDGELAQGTLVLFDLVSYEGICGPTVPWFKRNAALRHLFAAWDPPSCIRLVAPYLVEADEKRAALAALEEAGAEGAVFKLLDSTYMPGKQTAWRKWKFLDDVDAVIYGKGHEGKDNLMLAMADPTGDLVLPDGTVGRDVGRVSALQGDGPKAKIGQVVTVPVGGLGATGRLVEPRKPRIRTDKAPAECTIDQLDILRRIER